MSYLNQFNEHLKTHNFSSFSNLWEEYCQGDEVSSKDFKRLLNLVLDAPFKESFGTMVTQGLPLLEKLDDSNYKNEIFSLIVDLQTTNDHSLADTIIDFLKQTYKEDSNFQLKLRLVGLKDKVNFQRSIRNFVLLSHLHAGNFVFHTAGWGVGEIIEVSFLREEIQVDLDLVQGTKTLSFANAFKTLTPLDKEHFLSQRFGDPDRLEAKAKENPLYVIHLLLKDLGPMNASEMKEELLELVIPEADWIKWWQNVRAKLKKDPRVTAPSSQKDPFILHDEALTHDERILKKIEKNTSPAQFIDLVYSFLRDFPQAIKNLELKSAISSYIEKALRLESLSDAEHLSLLFLLEDVNPGSVIEQINQKIIQASSLGHLVKNMNVNAYKRKIVSIASDQKDDPCEEIAQCLLSLDQYFIKDFILQLLIEQKQETLICTTLEQALLAPVNYAKTIPWYLQKLLKTKTLPMATSEGKARFFEALLIIISNLEHKADHKELVKKMVQMLTNARFSLVREVFKSSSIEQIREFVLLATKCHIFTDQDIEIFHSLAEVVYPSLKKERKRAVVVEELPIIWSTQEGYQSIGEKIKHISTVETVENAKEIEEARSHGDLRENAEFKASLERRDRLQSELELLSSQYNQARILRKEDVKIDSVNVGVVVQCITPQGEEKIYTILGPFEADIKKNVISFQSKIAQDLIGKKKGEKVVVRNEELTITSLHNYFN